LFLRARLSDRDLDITLLTPARRFSYRPLSVLESFGGGPAGSLPPARLPAPPDPPPEGDAPHRGGAAGPPDATGRRARGPGARPRYDLLRVATGAEPRPHLPGALTFHGAADARALGAMLDAAARRLRPRVAFAVGSSTSWTLPLYELALLTAGELRARGVDPE